MPPDKGKRRATELLEAPGTPKRTQGPGLRLARLSELLSLDLGHDVAMSPSQREGSVEGQIVSKANFLFWKDRPALDEVLERLELKHYMARDKFMALAMLTEAFDKAKTDSLWSSGLKITSASPFQPYRIKDEVDPPTPTPKPRIYLTTRTNSSKSSLATSFQSVKTEVAEESPVTPPSDYDDSDLAFHPTSSTREVLDAQSLFLPPDAKPAMDYTTWDKGTVNQPKLVTSPSKNYRLAKIIPDGLTERSLPTSCDDLPFVLQVEAYRVMHASNLTARDLEREWPRAPKRSLESLKRAVRRLKPKRFELGSSTDFESVSLCAKLRYCEQPSQRLFDLELLPPKKEKSHSLQRRFGRDRCLNIDIPSQRPPSAYQMEFEDVLENLLKMLSRPQQLLGRTWRLIHAAPKIQPNKTYRVTLFAVSGQGISEIPISEVINYFTPIDLNGQQPVCKLFARLDLAMSRTTPTLAFDISQIHFVRDQIATQKNKDGESVVMSDGCCEISFGAMNQVRQILGLDFIPAVVQARIFGAKGIWYRSLDDESPDIWIKIADSQVKVKHDRKSTAFHDKERLTLNVNNWSRKPRPSLLYPDFLPILVNRGVSHEAILDIARHQIRSNGDEYHDALTNRLKLHQWIHSKSDLIAQRLTRGVEKVGNFANSHEERLCAQLEAGFEPTKFSNTAKEAITVGDNIFEHEGRKFKIELPQSTTLIGIADPTGLLAPDEIHVCFYSTKFTDPISGLPLIKLKNRDALVARNPSMRDSDIQRVQCVSKPELEHLRDVVVFPITGSQPIANMLSGGDYDGDNFWICWDPALVEPFQNALAPCKEPSIKPFGIVKDNLALNNLVTVPSYADKFDDQVNAWIYRSVKRRLRMGLLGTVTNYHAAFIYQHDDISSYMAHQLVDLHDLLVDADKQGYNFDEAAWTSWKQRSGFLQFLPTPAHRKFTREANLKDDRKNQGVPMPKKPGNIVDSVYFDVVEPEIVQIKLKARTIVQDAASTDNDLMGLFKQLRSSLPLNDGSVIDNELQSLKDELDKVHNSWSSGMGKYQFQDKDPKDWQDTVEKCFEQYENIQPQDTGHATVIEWMRKPNENASSIWDELKASALATLHHKPFGKFIFAIAGYKLCRMKAQASGDYCAIARDAWSSMKPKRRPEVPPILEGQRRELDDDDSDYFDGESVLDGYDDA